MPDSVWHNKSILEIYKILETNTESGLDSEEGERRLEYTGSNILHEKKRVQPWEIFIKQLTDFMVLVLLAAAMISGVLGDYIDALAIMAIVFLNSVLGFFQEYKAEKSIEALRSLSAPKALVLRDGRKVSIPTDNLVPGDILFLETGDRVPADCRLICSNNLEIEESALTGESLPVKKDSDLICSLNTSIGDRINMVHMGTLVTKGRADAVVVNTGMQTEMGRIAGMIQDVEEELTPLQKRLHNLGKWLVFFCLVICALVVVAGIVRGEPVYKMFLSGVSLAVAAIPEGLPAIVTVVLAIGVQRMIRRNAIIRKLPAVETLGCATVICSDKTGTITENKMTVRSLFTVKDKVEVTGEGYDPKGDFLKDKKEVDIRKDEDFKLLFKIAALCNNSTLKRGDINIPGLFRGKARDSGWNIEGEPTEGALSVVAAKAGIWREAVEREERRLKEFPFDSDRKRMSVVYSNREGNCFSYVKGAPDVIISLCTHFIENGETKTLTDSKKSEIIKEYGDMSTKALRVLSFAYKRLDADYTERDAENDLIFVGLMGMLDPPRRSAVKAIGDCYKAGIKPYMITGDYQLTAEAVARQVGLISKSEHVISGEELDRLNERELLQKIDDLVVFARVTPRHKMRIVKSLKSRGHTVAMTGDGVNDAPAVKEADIGISMGLTGTDVTKEASAMILTDDNFATIVSAIEEGRAIYDNIRKFIRYLLSCNVGEVLTMFLAVLIGLPLPLIPIQILWVNLVTDGLPAMALGVDNSDPNIMERKPRKKTESIFSRGLGIKIINRGIQIALGTLLVFYIALILGEGDIDIARTMAFTTLVLSQLFYVFECRSETLSPFQVGFFTNKYLVGAVICSLLMQLIVIYLPAMQHIFDTVPLNLMQWSIIIIVAGWKTIAQGLLYFLRPIGRKLIYLRV